mgnify:CR=1 FL=1
MNNNLQLIGGVLCAKFITVKPDVQVISDDIVNQFNDSDDDYIQDILEVILGTDPHDPSSYMPYLQYHA